MREKLAAAVELGRLGGLSRSPAKRAAVARNGRLAKHKTHLKGYCDFACMPRPMFTEFVRQAPARYLWQRDLYVRDWMAACRAAIALEGLDPARYWLDLWAAHHPPKYRRVAQVTDPSGPKTS